MRSTRSRQRAAPRISVRSAHVDSGNPLSTVFGLGGSTAMDLPHRPIQHPHLAKGDQTLNAIGFNSKQSHLVGSPYLQYSGLILAIGFNSKQRLINQFNKKASRRAHGEQEDIVAGLCSHDSLTEKVFLPPRRLPQTLFKHQVEYDK